MSMAVMCVLALAERLVHYKHLSGAAQPSCHLSPHTRQSRQETQAGTSGSQLQNNWHQQMNVGSEADTTSPTIGPSINRSGGEVLSNHLRLVIIFVTLQPLQLTKGQILTIPNFRLNNTLLHSYSAFKHIRFQSAPRTAAIYIKYSHLWGVRKYSQLAQQWNSWPLWQITFSIFMETAMGTF